MIKVKVSSNKGSCDNCNREMHLILKYSFCDEKGKEYNKLHLCEDCGNAVSKLFYQVMEEGNSFMYDKDEIKRVPKTIEELEEELCKYCPIPEESQGVHCYGGLPIMCENRFCPEAYESYLEEFEEENRWKIKK